MVFKGSYQAYDGKKMAKIVGTYLPISSKDSREIAREIQGKSVELAMKYLQAIIDKKQAVRFKRFKRDVPHRRGKGFGAGRFPRKASEHILKLIKHLKAIASDKTLDSDNLQIVHASAQRGSVLWHYGRIRGRRRKCTHFEAIAKELEKKKKKEEKKEEKKVEVKPEIKKEEPNKEIKPKVKKEPPKVEEKKEPKVEKKKTKVKKAKPKKEAKK